MPNLFLNCMTIQIKVIPRSKINQVVKLDSGHYKVKVIPAAEHGRANEKVREVLAEYFKVKKYQVEILSGFTIPDKFVKIDVVN